MKVQSSAIHSRGLGFDHRPIILGHDWSGYIAIRVKGFRSMALNGSKPYRLADIDVPHALGVIEVVGARSGLAYTSFWIGFSRDSKLPGPGFSLDSGNAVGTLVLPDSCFMPWLEILKSPHAHFRIGGDGLGNALASDLSLLESLA